MADAGLALASPALATRGEALVVGGSSFARFVKTNNNKARKHQLHFQRFSPSSAAAASMASGATQSRVLKLTPVPVTPESFAPYGTVVLPTDDGEVFGPSDARLDLSQGTPRVYIMRLRDRTLGFDRITHHSRVTQCLGAAQGGVWYLGVCPPSIVDPTASSAGPTDSKAVQSKSGHWYLPPEPRDVVVFKVEGPQILKLNAGTWHAGPLFTQPCMDFFNLELADTNVVDHTTHVFSKMDGLEFVFDP